MFTFLKKQADISNKYPPQFISDSASEILLNFILQNQ